MAAARFKGKTLFVSKWLQGSIEAIETEFDLLKDSLPVLGRSTVSLSARVCCTLARMTTRSRA